MLVASARGWVSWAAVGGATTVDSGGVGEDGKSSCSDLMMVWIAIAQFGLLQFVQRPAEVIAHLHDLQWPVLQAQQYGVNDRNCEWVGSLCAGGDGLAGQA